MTVALPDFGVQSAELRFIDRGGILRPSLGGADQRLDRLGGRWGMTVQTKPMKGEDARIWAARLVRGVREKASIRFSQPGIVMSAWTTSPSPYVYTNHAANAEVLQVAALNNIGNVVKEGQFISVLRADGKRYLYQATADATVNAGAVVTIPIQPPLRTALTDTSDLVTIANPRIEGYVTGDEAKWNIDSAKIYGFSFSIDEAQ